MRHRILVALFIVLVVSSSVAAQATNVNSISGTVFNEGRRPIAQAIVELLSEFNSVIQRTQTNQSGHFTFTRIPYGNYIVRAKTYGTDLEEQEKGVDIFNMGSPTRPMPMYEQVDFYLVRKKRLGGIPEITGVVFAQEVPKDAVAIYDSVNSDDSAEVATVKLQNAVRIFPRYHDALLRLGMVYIQAQKFAEAEEVLTTVVEVNPKGFAGWYGLGYSQFSLNRPVCIDSMRKAVDIDSSSVNGWLVLGLAQRKATNYDEALKALLQAKKLDDSKTADISWNLALLYYHNLKKPMEAAAELEIYLKIAKDAKNKEQVKALIKKFRSESPYESKT